MDAMELVQTGDVKPVWKKTGVLRYATVDPRPLGWVTDKLHTSEGEKTGSQVSGYSRSCVLSGDAGEQWVPAVDKLGKYSMPDGTVCTPEALQEEMEATGKPWVLISQASDNPQVQLGVRIPEDFMYRAPWDSSYQQAHAGDMLVINTDEAGNPAMTTDVDGNMVLDAWVIEAHEVNKIYEGPATEGYPEADLPTTIPYPTGITVDVDREIPNEVLSVLPKKNLEQMRLAEEAMALAEAEGPSEMLTETKEILQKISDGNDEFLSSSDLSPEEFESEFETWYWNTFHDVDGMVIKYGRTPATVALIKYDAENALMGTYAYERDLFPAQSKQASAIDNIRQACEAVRDVDGPQKESDLPSVS